MIEDFEKVKTKLEDQLTAKHKKAQFIDRKFILSQAIDVTTMSVLPKFPSSDLGQVQDKFKEHELRLSLMESKLKEFDTKFL